MSVEMEAPNGALQFNIYDLFANFLPGAYFLIGVSIPLMSTPGVFSHLTLATGLVYTFIAFVMGFLIQAFGAEIKYRDRPFERHMNAVVSDDDYQNLDQIGADDEFVSICAEEYYDDVESDEFNQWGELFKLVISDLEDSSCTRTLRIQALYLASRGLLFSSIMLFFYYLLYAIELPQNLVGFTPQLDNVAFVFEALTVLMIMVSIVFYIRTKHFERDVVRYMISESCLKYGKHNPP